MSKTAITYFSFKATLDDTLDIWMQIVKCTSTLHEPKKTHLNKWKPKKERFLLTSVTTKETNFL